MVVFGWITAVAGNVLFVASLINTVRANPARRIPFYRNPPIIPAGSIGMRSVGAGLLVFGAVSLSSMLGPWSLAIVFAGPTLALIVIPIHNLHLAAVTTR